MDYNPLYDRLWGADGVNPFGNPYKLDEEMNELMENKDRGKKTFQEMYEELETEMYEYLKGDFKTTIVCKFNKQGYLISHTAQCVNIAEDRAIMQAMREELFKALDEERYEDAKTYQEKINQLRQILEINKPTL